MHRDCGNERGDGLRDRVSKKIGLPAVLRGGGGGKWVGPGNRYGGSPRCTGRERANGGGAGLFDGSDVSSRESISCGEDG